MRKRVLFIANTLDNAYKFQQVLLDADVEVSAGTTLQAKRLFASRPACDLAVFDASGPARSHLGEIEALAEACGCPLLFIVDEGDLGDMALPSCVPCDFVVQDASRTECTARVRRLLYGQVAGEDLDSLAIGNMTINLATYQVTVADDPIDFTYLEYALLTYLVQHPNRTFTRDALLRSVWKLGYYGGARTVDVHVRRIRSKLGPDLAQHLETIRGVGYLWRMA